MVCSDKILEPVQKNRFHVQEELGPGLKSFGKGEHFLQVRVILSRLPYYFHKPKASEMSCIFHSDKCDENINIHTHTTRTRFSFDPEVQ